MRKFGIGSLGAAGALLTAAAARAESQLPELPVIGAPTPGGMHFQPPVTELARDIIWLDTFLHVIMGLIVLLVVGLMAYAILRFRASANPKPATFTHNTKIEVAWTAGPVVILLVIGFFSVPILFKQLDIPEPDVTIKTTGFQWYWSYEYPDHDFEFLSLMLQQDELEEFGYAPEYYLLATDTAMVVPVDAVVRLQVTAADVIHSWTIPSFGVKMDGIPGRLNETWFRAEQEGIYFGQCSELCGQGHAYMPITVKVVSQEDYEAWLDRAIEQYGGTPREQTEEMAAAR